MMMWQRSLFDSVEWITAMNMNIAELAIANC